MRGRNLVDRPRAARERVSGEPLEFRRISGLLRSLRALETLERAIAASDFAAASRARTDLLGALFDEGVTLA